MPHTHRLTRSDFSTPTGKSRRFSCPLFSLSITEGVPTESTKVGIIVSKKVSPKATDRNVVKRRLRAGVRPMLGLVPRGLTIVIIARKEALGATMGAMRREMERMLTPYLI